MKKKKAIICITVAIAVVVTVSVCLGMFLPRKVSYLVPLNGVESVTASWRTGEYIPLTVSKEEFMQVLTSVKYRPRYYQIKAVSPYKITLNYDSGKVITVDGWWIRKNGRAYAIELMMSIEDYLKFPKR